MIYSVLSKRDCNLRWGNQRTTEKQDLKHSLKICASLHAVFEGLLSPFGSPVWGYNFLFITIVYQLAYTLSPLPYSALFNSNLIWAGKSLHTPLLLFSFTWHFLKLGIYLLSGLTHMCTYAVLDSLVSFLSILWLIEPLPWVGIHSHTHCQMLQWSACDQRAFNELGRPSLIEWQDLLQVRAARAFLVQLQKNT